MKTDEGLRDARIGVVVIGRNEGERLKRCLDRLAGLDTIVYVDSGSTDGSIDAATDRGIEAVALSAETGFTAARARNAGLAHFAAMSPPPDYIQMIDGDCEIATDWLRQGVSALEGEDQLAVVFGRTREKYPEKTIYNRLCDDEWNVPVGYANSCGGIALFRFPPLNKANGFSETLIAGEEPDLCLRLRTDGWKVRRIDAEMTLHDAAMTRFGQWWRRAKRSGHAYAEHVWRHRGRSDRGWIKQLISISFWALMLPIGAFAAISFGELFDVQALTIVGVMMASLYGLQWMRIVLRKRKSGSDVRFSAAYAAFMLIGKFAELSGVLSFFSKLARGAEMKLIEHRSAP